MNSIIRTIFLDKNPKLKDITRESYIYNVSNLMDLLVSKDLNIIYKNYKKVFEVVKENYIENNSQANKYTACKAIIRCLVNNRNKKKIDEALEAYRVELAILKNKIEKKLATHIKSKHEEETWINKKDEENISILLQAKIPETISTLSELCKLRDYVIFTFYRNLSTRTELADSKFYYDDECNIDTLLKDDIFNYIVLKKNENKVIYILNNYKTVKRYGHVIIDLGNNMYDLLVKYKEYLKLLSKTNYFLISTIDKKLARPTLSKLFTSFGSEINKKISIRTLRHIRVSNNINIENVSNLASKMMHDPITALSIYAKI